MNTTTAQISQRERELAAIITAYSEVTEELKQSHDKLSREVHKLRLEIEDKSRELDRSERLAALGQMATGVAHEIRNPLGSIQLYASLLDRDLSALPKSQKLVRKIAAGVNALDRIVGEILDFAGRYEMEAAQVSLQMLVANVFDIAAPRAASRNVNLLIDTSVLDVELWVDRLQLERALLNLVLNGLESAPQGGTVAVATEPAGDGMIALSVRDDGPGVDEANFDRVFNPFFTTKECGTGLGLAIVHRIVETHGGSISVQNLEEGGACFTMRLPTDCRGVSPNWTRTGVNYGARRRCR